MMMNAGVSSNKSMYLFSSLPWMYNLRYYARVSVTFSISIDENRYLQEIFVTMAQISTNL